PHQEPGPARAVPAEVAAGAGARPGRRRRRPGPVDLGDGDHSDHGCPAGMSLDTLGIVALEILNSITILVLLALGLALIFGMMRTVNLAQGEFFTAGPFTVLTAVRHAHLQRWHGVRLLPVV